MNQLFPSLASAPTAAGHFKKGIMLAPVTGKILADLITTGRTHLPIGPLDPARFV
jgi:glycine/D-amino acid oxidase-like deaminating enzyme